MDTELDLELDFDFDLDPDPGRDSDLEADPDPNSDFDHGLNLHLNWPWRCSRPGLRLGIEISDRCEPHSHSDLSPDPNFESDSADPDPVFVLGLWPGCLVLYLQQSLFGLHQRDSMHEFQHVLVSSSITTEAFTVKLAGALKAKDDYQQQQSI